MFIYPLSNLTAYMLTCAFISAMSILISDNINLIIAKSTVEGFLVFKQVVCCELAWMAVNNASDDLPSFLFFLFCLFVTVWYRSGKKVPNFHNLIRTFLFLSHQLMLLCGLIDWFVAIVTTIGFVYLYYISCYTKYIEKILRIRA